MIIFILTIVWIEFIYSGWSKDLSVRKNMKFVKYFWGGIGLYITDEDQELQPHLLEVFQGDWIFHCLGFKLI